MLMVFQQTLVYLESTMESLQGQESQLHRFDHYPIVKSYVTEWNDWDSVVLRGANYGEMGKWR